MQVIQVKKHVRIMKCPGVNILVQGLGLRIVENVDEADFILAHGTEALGLYSGASMWP